MALPHGSSARAAAPASAEPPGAILLIDGGVPAGQAPLPGCDRAIGAAHANLDKAGVLNRVVSAPTADGLRLALLRFGNETPGPAKAVLFCGYAVRAGGDAFALGSGFRIGDEPAFAAVSIRAFARASDVADGLAVLDLHPAGTNGSSEDAEAAGLQAAAAAWSADPGSGATRIAVIDRAHADATAIDKAVAGTDTGSPAVIARALSGGTAITAIAATPGVPATGEPAPVGQAASSAAAAPSAPIVPPPPPVRHDAGRATDRPTQRAPKPLAVVVRPHAHGDRAIRRIQVALLARGLFSGRVDGIVSAETRNGIRHFQALLGHPATGRLTAEETLQLTGG